MKNRRHCQSYTHIAKNLDEKKNEENGNFSSDLAIFLFGLGCLAMLYVVFLVDFLL